MKYGETEDVKRNEDGNEYRERERYHDGKITFHQKTFKVRDVVTSDAEELAMFINFQRENKGKAGICFSRETKDKTRYVVREYVD